MRWLILGCGDEGLETGFGHEKEVPCWDLFFPERLTYERL